MSGKILFRSGDFPVEWGHNFGCASSATADTNIPAMVSVLTVWAKRPAPLVDCYAAAEPILPKPTGINYRDPSEQHQGGSRQNAEFAI